MAIGTTPLFSKISGSAGPVDFRTRRNGKIEIGKKRIPANPQSTRQLEVRAGYGRLHELWQNASYIDKAQYERLGKLYHISAWNAFLLRHQSAMSAAPVASWGMVESSGSDLHDLTTNENTGTIFGAVWDEIGPSALSSLSFDGIDDVVLIPENATLKNQNFTIDFWTYPNEPILNSGIFGTTGYSSKKGWGLYSPGSSVYALWMGNGVTNFFISPIFTMYQGLHHYTLTKNGATMKSYCDAIPVITDAVTMAGVTIDYTGISWELGKVINNTYNWKGLIPPTNLFPYAMTQQQITKIHNIDKKLYGVYP